MALTLTNKRSLKMKESTKDKKAMAEFKAVAKTCKTNFISLADHELTVAGTNYTCAVWMEDQNCEVYKNFGGFDCYLVDNFNL